MKKYGKTPKSYIHICQNDCGIFFGIFYSFLYDCLCCNNKSFNSGFNQAYKNEDEILG